MALPAHRFVEALDRRLP